VAARTRRLIGYVKLRLSQDGRGASALD